MIDTQNPLAGLQWGNATTPTPDMATSQALKSGADPIDLARAKQELGKAEYIGYCQSFVEQATGSGWKGSSASDAWQNQQDTAVADPTLTGAKPGDEVYFSDPNNSDGHVGILSGPDTFVSATDNGVQENSIPDWQNLTGQTVNGYIPLNPTPRMDNTKNPLANVKWGAN